MTQIDLTIYKYARWTRDIIYRFERHQENPRDPRFPWIVEDEALLEELFNYFLLNVTPPPKFPFVAGKDKSYAQLKDYLQEQIIDQYSEVKANLPPPELVSLYEEHLQQEQRQVEKLQNQHPKLASARTKLIQDLARQFSQVDPQIIQFIADEALTVSYEIYPESALPQIVAGLQQLARVTQTKVSASQLAAALSEEDLVASLAEQHPQFKEVLEYTSQTLPQILETAASAETNRLSSYLVIANAAGLAPAILTPSSVELQSALVTRTEPTLTAPKVSRVGELWDNLLTHHQPQAAQLLTQLQEVHHHQHQIAQELTKRVELSELSPEDKHAATQIVTQNIIPPLLYVSSFRQDGAEKEGVLSAAQQVFTSLGIKDQGEVNQAVANWIQTQPYFLRGIQATPGVGQYYGAKYSSSKQDPAIQTAIEKIMATSDYPDPITAEVAKKIEASGLGLESQQIATQIITQRILPSLSYAASFSPDGAEKEEVLSAAQRVFTNLGIAEYQRGRRVYSEADRAAVNWIQTQPYFLRGIHLSPSDWARYQAMYSSSAQVGDTFQQVFNPDAGPGLDKFTASTIGQEVAKSLGIVQKMAPSDQQRRINQEVLKLIDLSKLSPQEKRIAAQIITQQLLPSLQYAASFAKDETEKRALLSQIQQVFIHLGLATHQKDSSPAYRTAYLWMAAQSFYQFTSAGQPQPRPSPEVVGFYHQLFSFASGKIQDKVTRVAMQKFLSSSMGKGIASALGLGTKAATTAAAKAGLTKAVSGIAIKALAAIGIADPEPITKAIIFVATLLLDKLRDVASWLKRKFKDFVLPVLAGLLAIGLAAIGGVTSLFGLAAVGVVGGIGGSALSIGGLSRLGAGASRFFTGLAGLAVTQIATPIIVIVLTVPVILALFLFIINNSAYIVPQAVGTIPGGGGGGGPPTQINCFIIDGFSEPAATYVANAINTIVATNYGQRLCSNSNQVFVHAAVQQYLIDANGNFVLDANGNKIPFGGRAPIAEKNQIYLFPYGTSSQNTATYTLAHESGHVFSQFFGAIYDQFDLSNISQSGVEGYLPSYNYEFSTYEDFAETVGVGIRFGSNYFLTGFSKPYSLHKQFFDNILNAP